MAKPVDDVPLSEVFTRAALIVLPITLLIGAELLYRWLTHPEDSFWYYQELLTWVWVQMHSMLFGSETISYVANEGGPTTVVMFNHSAFQGSSLNALEVSDECAGIHEIAFTAFLIWMTPNVSNRLKLRGMLTFAGLLAFLNVIRLIVLYPLALGGCLDAPGQYGCWSKMWSFHEFMLEYGFMLIILLSWTLWYVSLGGPKFDVKVNPREFIEKAKEAKLVKRDSPLAPTSYFLLSVALIALLNGAYHLALDEDSRRMELESDGCDGVLSADCENARHDWENVEGRALRQLLIGVTIPAFVLIRIDNPQSEDEEE